MLPNAARDDMLVELVDGLVLHLFVNDWEPSARDRAAAYTEASFPGYRPVTLTRADWSVTRGQASTAPVRFEQTADAPNFQPQIAHGWYLTTQDGRLRWTDRFRPDPNAEHQPPYAMLRKGDWIDVPVTVSLRGES